ncbi:Potassium voltage-gated channel subfamily H member 6 [Acromyrmex echinatior]|uniref:Potassium voltage-gated channel subfamily H member 6 n=1 Tax=Acromyrmex echinatior TaxID=103372 RepID=F4X161_ACREC|nr:Potassium voltage-gated channel subfamily H member 6 [Acromyrmex echinatior]
MPVRRGHVAPRTTIIETIIRKFDTHDRSFLVANAQQGLCHIIYCSDGFCRLTGFSRAEVMQRPAVCDFLHGPMTSPHAVAALRDALAAGVEKHFEILYYRKDGEYYLLIFANNYRFFNISTKTKSVRLGFTFHSLIISGILRPGLHGAN